MRNAIGSHYNGIQCTLAYFEAYQSLPPSTTFHPPPSFRRATQVADVCGDRACWIGLHEKGLIEQVQQIQQIQQGPTTGMIVTLTMIL